MTKRELTNSISIYFNLFLIGISTPFIFYFDEIYTPAVALNSGFWLILFSYEYMQLLTKYLRCNQIDEESFFVYYSKYHKE